MTLVHNEQVKLTAAYLNTAAGAFLGAGVVAPLAAAVFGLAGSFAVAGALTLGVGVLIFFMASIALHFAARYLLRTLIS